MEQNNNSDVIDELIQLSEKESINNPTKIKAIVKGENDIWVDDLSKNVQYWITSDKKVAF